MVTFIVKYYKIKTNEILIITNINTVMTIDTVDKHRKKSTNKQINK